MERGERLLSACCDDGRFYGFVCSALLTVIGGSFFGVNGKFFQAHGPVSSAVTVFETHIFSADAPHQQTFLTDIDDFVKDDTVTK